MEIIQYTFLSILHVDILIISPKFFFEIVGHYPSEPNRHWLNPDGRAYKYRYTTMARQLTN